jgi:hypothetical protein
MTSVEIWPGRHKRAMQKFPRKGGTNSMPYTEPQILSTLSATSEIQQINELNSAKAPGQYLDHAIPPISCTVSAYEADE